MLCLKAPTHPEWVHVAATHIADIMRDHAHCEKKAAFNALNLIMRYPDKHDLVREALVILEEETAHFKLILGELEQRGLSLGIDAGNPYAQQLSSIISKREPMRLLDSLLVDCLIEARSCERFTLLAGCESIPPDIRGIYHTLMASEEGHYTTFVAIAKRYFPANLVDQRLEEIASYEATIVQSLTNQPAMHG
ncbi:MAG: tRNA-(ms[2]io[6]A)-hydroxylase [Bacteroidota bacterium]|nr:tRNA-(ms[2]io[6]A)-hydroxylase [Candidatus Kapabacteria bacterium]MDW8219618.1 tRNA-(ms[2]io[6]A)-hydroxylase [Bacteroidota bacterium]